MTTETKPPIIPGLGTALLRWYFGPGQSVFEKSSMGASLDRAQTYSNHAAYHEQVKRVNAERRERAKEAADRYEYAPVDGFKGVVQYTAVPTAEVHPAPSHDVNDEALMRFARASRGLQRLARICAHGPDVLRSWLGEGSEGWANAGFRIGGVYRHTEAGRALIKQIREEAAKAKAKLHISDAALLSNDHRRATHAEDRDRLVQFGVVEGEARAVVAEAIEMWNALHKDGCQ